MSERPHRGALLLGAAEVDITPAVGVHMGGDLCRFRPVERVLDPLHARALVVEAPGARKARRFCLLALELCTAGDDAAADIRRTVAERFGFDRRAVMLHLLQNHSAPSLGTHLLLRPDSPHVTPELWWTYQGDPQYYEFLVPRIGEAVGRAIDALAPVSMAVGGMADGRAAFNRRFVMRDGWVQTQPRDLSQVLHPEGPADPEVGVACFRNAAGEPVACLLHHTAHPVSHFGKNWVTASWPGAWTRAVREILGPRCVPIVLNGCCGNVNPWNAIMPTYETSDELVGRWLTETAQQVLKAAPWRDAQVAGFRSRTLRIPYAGLERTIGRQAIRRARDLLAREPQPRWINAEHTVVDVEWLFAAVTSDMARRLCRGAYPYIVQAFRIGDLGIVGLTGEPFAEGQLRIKLQSPAERTFVAHMCNGWVGYIPTRHAYAAKNCDFRTPEGASVRRGANLFLLVPEALDTIADTAHDLLAGLFR